MPARRAAGLGHRRRAGQPGAATRDPGTCGARRAAVTPPFHADHVGSLLRPARLREAFRAQEGARTTHVEFGSVTDEAIRDVVALQESVGLQPITDGEFRRSSYWAHFVEAVDGLSTAPALFEFTDAEGERMAFHAPHIVGRLRRARPISAAEFTFLRKVTTRTPKVTMPAPSTMHFWRGPQAFEPDAYDTIGEFFADLGAVYRAEIAELAGLGATYLQLDEVALAMLCDADVRAAVTHRGEDPDVLVDRYVAAIRDAITGRPEGVTVSMHLCRGNYKGRWMAVGGYEPVAERVFGRAGVDALFLEYDSPRAGDFTPLRYVAADTAVVLGLVSSKDPKLESRDELLRRIEEATRYVPVERLGLSPQCGFASTVAGNPVTEDDEKRKLALVVDVAEEVWGR
ncbi:MAG: 5-methyltetrahydropteroyltriglutamate--homocysteine S-methyltransferase [Pseudonocardiaceae bacterium]|nr:5-methyltetrahydropteroyltriglutamate--homocysteine S-methyltransferase [Pseudonocardiaceae bacterium]